MSIADWIKNNLSSLASNTAGTQSIVDIIGTGSTDPTQAMDAHRSAQNLPGLSLPSDMPPYYFRIGINEYTRRAWNDVGDLTPIAVINLPVPMNIVDTHQVAWKDEELGILGAGALAAMGGGAGLSDVVDTFGRTLRRGAMNIAAQAVGAVAPGIASGIGASLGMAINNYLTMMMRGPIYKRHNFDWKFSPNTKAETETMTKMYAVLNNAMAPTLVGGGSAFFGYPKIFKLDFIHSRGTDMGRMLYRFKPVVLSGNRWNFSPHEAPAFYGETQGPYAVDVHMEFVELEFWLQGDFKNI